MSCRVRSHFGASILAQEFPILMLFLKSGNQHYLSLAKVASFSDSERLVCSVHGP